MKQKNRGLARRNSRYGRLFVLPWELGIILFFLVPLFQSVIYSFSNVSFVGDQLQVVFAGLKHYRQLLITDGTYTYFLIESVRDFCSSLPIIVILSLIFSLILNMKFPGRMLARAVFFLPVIIASGAIMELVFIGGSGPEGTSSYTSNILDLDAVLRSLEIPEKLIVLFSEIMENIFDLVWSCGVQTVLFIAGLQTIPDALYEVSRVEGSNKWEEFWFITFPMLNNTFVLVIVYTMIGIVTDKNNTMMKMPFQLMTQSQIYDESSARLWLYFAIVGALMSVVMFAYKRLLARRWE